MIDPKLFLQRTILNDLDLQVMTDDQGIVYVDIKNGINLAKIRDFVNLDNISIDANLNRISIDSKLFRGTSLIDINCFEESVAIKIIYKLIAMAKTKNIRDTAQVLVNDDEDLDLLADGFLNICTRIKDMSSLQLNENFYDKFFELIKKLFSAKSKSNTKENKIPFISTLLQHVLSKTKWECDLIGNSIRLSQELKGLVVSDSYLTQIEYLVEKYFGDDINTNRLNADQTKKITNMLRSGKLFDLVKENRVYELNFDDKVMSALRAVSDQSSGQTISDFQLQAQIFAALKPHIKYLNAPIIISKGFQRDRFDKKDPQEKWNPISDDGPSDKDFKLVNENIDFSGQEWTIRGLSKRGLSHQHDGTWCDDNLIAKHFEKWVLLVACDGMGSAPLSRIGSAFFTSAIKTFTKPILERFERILAHLGDDALSHDSIRADLFETFRSEIILMVYKVRDALIKRAPSYRATLKDFNTTLLLTLVRDCGDFGHWVINMQIGDGAISLITRKKEEGNELPTYKFIQTTKAMRGEHASETQSVTQQEISESVLRSSISELMVNDLYTVALMTDGVSEDFEESADLMNIFFGNPIRLPTDNYRLLDMEDRPLLGYFMGAIYDDDEAFKDWMSYFKVQSSDDRTLLMLYPKSPVFFDPERVDGLTSHQDLTYNSVDFADLVRESQIENDDEYDQCLNLIKTEVQAEQEAQYKNIAPESSSIESSEATSAPESSSVESSEATSAPESSSGDSSEATSAPEPSSGDSSEATSAPESSSGDSSEATSAPEPSSGDSSEATSAPEPSSASSVDSSAANDIISSASDSSSTPT